MWHTCVLFAQTTQPFVGKLLSMPPPSPPDIHPHTHLWLIVVHHCAVASFVSYPNQLNDLQKEFADNVLCCGGGCTKIQPPFLSAMHVCGFRLINLWPFIRRYTHTCAWLSRTGRLDGNPYIIRKPHVFWLKKKSFIARRVNWKGFFFYTQLKSHLHY